MVRARALWESPLLTRSRGSIRPQKGGLADLVAETLAHRSNSAVADSTGVGPGPPQVGGAFSSSPAPSISLPLSANASFPNETSGRSAWARRRAVPVPLTQLDIDGAVEELLCDTSGLNVNLHHAAGLPPRDFLRHTALGTHDSFREPPPPPPVGSVPCRREAVAPEAPVLPMSSHENGFGPAASPWLPPPPLGNAPALPGQVASSPCKDSGAYAFSVASSTPSSVSPSPSPFGAWGQATPSSRSGSGVFGGPTAASMLASIGRSTVQLKAKLRNLQEMMHLLEVK
eukprot:TRINITY_DN19907_c0_g1_i1.p1 TRINITY_DN19907_c0_g1~~TRINITY_DN19907_c0_g1_i1.p1  ORF type:complete len:307 (-),score=51.67 TRINITY_DN19907_c0_g1_i1:56-913(-)